MIDTNVPNSYYIYAIGDEDIRDFKDLYCNLSMHFNRPHVDTVYLYSPTMTKQVYHGMCFEPQGFQILREHQHPTDKRKIAQTELGNKLRPYLENAAYFIGHKFVNTGENNEYIASEYFFLAKQPDQYGFRQFAFHFSSFAYYTLKTYIVGGKKAYKLTDDELFSYLQFFMDQIKIVRNPPRLYHFNLQS